MRHPLRLGSRLLWLAGELGLAGLGFLVGVLICRSGSLVHARARWLQHSCRRVLRIFNVDLRAEGPRPSTGMLVSNHLSYLDVLVLSTLAPAVFVAKREVRLWPVFGWFAMLAGTVFVDRQKRTQVRRATGNIEAALDSGVLVVLFPEGTSSDGQTVLPFKSSLLEPVAKCSRPLSTALIEYRLDDGDAGEEVCYWKDMTFLPHLLNLLCKRSIKASVWYSQLENRTSNRKELARQLRTEVLRLKEARRNLNRKPDCDLLESLPPGDLRQGAPA